MAFEIEENGILREEIEPVLEGLADLLKEDGGLVGACIKNERGDYFEIDHIGIKEEYRGEDRGTEFVSMYEDMAKARDFDLILAMVQRGDERAINFWENHAEWTRGENIEDQCVFYKHL